VGVVGVCGRDRLHRRCRREWCGCDLRSGPAPLRRCFLRPIRPLRPLRPTHPAPTPRQDASSTPTTPADACSFACCGASVSWSPRPLHTCRTPLFCTPSSDPRNRPRWEPLRAPRWRGLSQDRSLRRPKPQPPHTPPSPPLPRPLLLRAGLGTNSRHHPRSHNHHLYHHNNSLPNPNPPLSLRGLLRDLRRRSATATATETAQRVHRWRRHPHSSLARLRAP
jgi:hypothetical protein